MIDMLSTIIPKSDQLNADDLIGGVLKVIRITGVSRCKEPEQPIAISFEGDNGKPYKPGKSMRRVLVNVWGPDGQAYIGRSMELYRDDAVKFGGLEVGGIRISRMSDIDKPITMALTATKASRKPFTVRPLIQEKAGTKKAPSPKEIADTLAERFALAENIDAHNALMLDDMLGKQLAWLQLKQPELYTQVDAAIKASIARNTADEPDDDASMIRAPGDEVETL